MANDQDGILRRWWAVLRKPSAKYSILAIFAVSFAAGIVFWGGFNTGLEATNTLGF
jgi:cytochrome c-type protein NapC